ncbi:alpha/beta hydrolase [soil metagenome]
MLHHELVAPDGVVDGAPMVVLLHGRGSDERDLLDLGSALVPGAIVVTPRAPFSGTPWGYGPGWAWYRYLGRNRPEEASFDESLKQLDELIQALPGRLPVKAGAVVLGGFSQGGTISLAYALSQPGRVELVLNFSGFLADHPAVEEGLTTAANQVRAFWGHGTGDPSIPHVLAVEGRARLVEAGAKLNAQDYEIGHWIAPEELKDAADWVSREVGAPHGRGRRG